MIGYVYLTYDTLKHKVYVGQHQSETYDKTYFGSGTIIKNIIKKRKDTLRNYVLECCDTLDNLNDSEVRWITYFREEFGEENCYNICSGGSGLTEDVKAKLSEVNKSHIVTQETRIKIGAKNKGVKRTQEQKDYISQKTKEGMEASGAAEKISKKLKGRKLSEEHCENMSKATKGKINIGEKNGMYGKVPINAVKVINKETGQIFQSIMECQRFYNITKKVMFRWLNQHINNLYRLE